MQNPSTFVKIYKSYLYIIDTQITEYQNGTDYDKIDTYPGVAKYLVINQNNTGDEGNGTIYVNEIK